MSQEERRDQDTLREPEEYYDQDEEQAERFYDGETDDTPDEEPAAQDKAQAGDVQDGEVDDLQFFLGLMDYLRDALTGGKTLPFTTKRLVDVGQCLKILDDMRKNLPQAVEYGMLVYEELNRMVKSAEDQAAGIISSAEVLADKSKKKVEAYVSDRLKESDAKTQDAERQAQMLISESEIVRRAEEEARRIINDAKNEAREYRVKVHHDIKCELGQSQRALQGSANRLDNLRKHLEESSEKDDY